MSNGKVARFLDGGVGPPLGVEWAGQQPVTSATLPAGCISPQVAGGTYYLCANTWFRPSYGANGVYYRVVPAP